MTSLRLDWELPMVSSLALPGVQYIGPELGRRDASDT